MAQCITLKNGKTITPDPTKAFQFLYMQDCGPCDFGGGSGCCPHCGAEGRYIYYWSEFGEIRGAMKGCYKALTGRIDKDDYTKFMETMCEKQTKDKPLNGWQKTVLRMQQFISDGKYSVEWCEQKIHEAIADQKRYAFSRGR